MKKQSIFSRLVVMDYHSDGLLLVAFFILNFAFFMLSSVEAFSQVGIAINNYGAINDNSALLDVSCAVTGTTGYMGNTGSRQGVLIPRMALASTVDIDGFYPPVVSLIVYNTGAAG